MGHTIKMTNEEQDILKKGLVWIILGHTYMIPTSLKLSHYVTQFKHDHFDCDHAANSPDITS